MEKAVCDLFATSHAACWKNRASMADRLSQRSQMRSYLNVCSENFRPKGCALLVRAVPRQEFCEPLIEFAALQNIATFQPDGSHAADRISCERDAMPNERPTGLLAEFSKPFSERDQAASFSPWRRFPRLQPYDKPFGAENDAQRGLSHHHSLLIRALRAGIHRAPFV
jgi:hypothetical protein